MRKQYTGLETSMHSKVFDQIVDHSIEMTDPKEGIAKVRIDSYHIGHIPGLSPHWQYELEHRKKEIEQLNDQNCLEKLINFIVGQENPAKATGEELYEISPTKITEELVDGLKNDPKDMDARIKLVSYVAQKKRKGIIRKLS